MTQPFYTGTVKKKPKEVKLMPCGLAYTWYCPCGAFQITLADELSFGAVKCSACKNESVLDVPNASGKTPEKPSEKKTWRHTKAADKVQDLLG